MAAAANVVVNTSAISMMACVAMGSTSCANPPARQMNTQVMKMPGVVLPKDDTLLKAESSRACGASAGASPPPSASRMAHTKHAPDIRGMDAAKAAATQPSMADDARARSAAITADAGAAISRSS